MRGVEDFDPSTAAAEVEKERLNGVWWKKKDKPVDKTPVEIDWKDAPGAGAARLAAAQAEAEALLNAGRDSR